ncbi:MAG: Flp pilus assembly protein CpaB [Actinobacteria bacterium]|nr:Flp pilus assembly protein CpaB [Actinomycetota bacterium]
MTYRVRNIGIAIVLAIVAALLTTFYVTNYKRNVQQGEDMVPVYVAAQNIDIGTPGSELSSRKLLKVDHVSRRSVVPGAISEPEQVSQRVAVEAIYAGEQISTNRFRAAEEQGVRAQLKGNLRAFQVAGSEAELLAGTLKAGDRVDVIGAWVFPENSQNHVSRVVLRDLLVLRPPETNQVQSKLGSDPNSPFSAMLAMTDAQTQKFWWVVQNGKWSLQLRPVTDPADTPDSYENSGSLLADGLRPGARRRLNGARR